MMVQVCSFELLKSFSLKARSTPRRFESGATVIHGLEALVLWGKWYRVEIIVINYHYQLIYGHSVF